MREEVPSALQPWALGKVPIHSLQTYPEGQGVKVPLLTGPCKFSTLSLGYL